METYADRTLASAAGVLTTCPSVVVGRAGALGAVQAASSRPSASRASPSEERPFTMTLLSCGRRVRLAPARPIPSIPRGSAGRHGSRSYGEHQYAVTGNLLGLGDRQDLANYL